MDRYQYLLLMGLCVAITLPLEVLFRARVWRRPRRLAGALAPALVIFVAWDLWATASGTWGFSDAYTIGVDLPGGMAVEELVFFTVIPVCGLLTLETVRRILRIWDATDGSTRARLQATVRGTFRADALLRAPATEDGAGGPTGSVAELPAGGAERAPQPAVQQPPGEVVAGAADRDVVTDAAAGTSLGAPAGSGTSDAATRSR